MRLPRDSFGIVRFPHGALVVSRVKRFKFSARRLRIVAPKLVFQHCYDTVVPHVMEILLRGGDVYRLAGPAAISVGRRMQGLMDVADEMNQKREFTGRAPFIISPIAKATRVLVDFCRHAIPMWAPRR